MASDDGEAACEALIERAIDVLLAEATGGDVWQRQHLRRTGEFAKRIAEELDGAFSAQFIRRCALLSGIPPRVLNLIPELRGFARVVAYCQEPEATPSGDPLLIITRAIVEVSDAFDRMIDDQDHRSRFTPAAALDALYAHPRYSRAIVEALAHALHGTP